MTRVGFVGAGRMGAPMVRRLVEHGHDVTVLGRSDETRSAAAQLGSTPAASVVEAATSADVVVVCVFTDDQVRQVCLEDGLIAAMRPGAVLVIHTTGSPDTARSLAATAAGGDVAVLDAPVSGGPHDIAAGALTVFAGGDEDAVARVRPVLESYTAPLLHVGPLGAGQSVKLVNNALFAAQIGALREAVRLGAELGVAEGDLLAALPHGSAASRVLTLVGSRGSVTEFVDMAGAFVGKDVDVVRRIASAAGADLGLLDGLVDAGVHS
ncbi:NAD(P)-dependent oxidoreductase [Mycolicibacterium sp. F2034L]|uniref:NAD(P)-dependent oxidoreductase n=1 Tax=Mycolicibacterium sp. F2034L TaxID=2926422 RepID=UPI001FF15FF2|nr:NAD(P)-dependent oxidoreductase [Mycolicibacterium sp. F2034L]MCK0176593.1 NAD(P)-dependent oxidoreductase [Mycolicibacterium sp. F2034L]